MREIVKQVIRATHEAEKRLETKLPGPCNEAVAEWLSTDVDVMQRIKDAIKADVPPDTLLDMVDGVRAIKAKAIIELQDNA